MKAKKVKTSKKVSKKTHIALILDKSGSMQGCLNETITGFNSQLEVIRKNMEKGGETTVTLVTFNENVNILQEAVHADSVQGIDNQSYLPNGSTAMYDAVHDAIESLKKLDDGQEQTAFLVITISDGMENASRRISSVRLAEKIQELENTKRWTFGYVGANQDLAKVSEKLNLQYNNTFAFDSNTTRGQQVMYAAVNCSTADYMHNRSKGATYSENLYGSEKKDENI
jgi:uncharacterized protein YegL